MKLRTKFQDEDFELGEVVDAHVNYGAGDTIKLTAKALRGGLHILYYDSIKDFTDHWEDAPEEPKKYYYIDCDGDVRLDAYSDSVLDESCKSIGNYFETEEQAEKAVEKLKAWQRLKEKGFRITLRGAKGNAWLEANWGNLKGDYEDVYSLFGGEE